MKVEEREHGVTAFVDDAGRVWAQCAPASQSESDYVIEGPLCGFIYDEGTFTEDSERAFRSWLADRLIDDEIFYLKDKDTAAALAERIAERIAEAAQRILKDREPA